MGCNAWNHYEGCDCGWGGDTGNYGRIPTILERLELKKADYFESFTRLTRCPVCGDEVYFYSNENGSAVFFDNLGKPWPKHGCTDQSRRKHVLVAHKFTPFRLKSEGWIPLFPWGTTPKTDKIVVSFKIEERHREKLLVLWFLLEPKINWSNSIVLGRATEDERIWDISLFDLVERRAHELNALVPRVRKGQGDIFKDERVESDRRVATNILKIEKEIRSLESKLKNIHNPEKIFQIENALKKMNQEIRNLENGPFQLHGLVTRGQVKRKKV